MKVREAMSTVLLTAPGTTTIAEAASLMAQRRVGSTLVMEGRRVRGIFTERDIVKALSQDGAAIQQAIEHWMTRAPRTIGPDAPLEEALEQMIRGQFRHLHQPYRVAPPRHPIADLVAGRRSRRRQARVFGLFPRRIQMSFR